jgi:hypothetical protein
MGRVDAGRRLTRYFFFFFGLCAAHVSHIELSPPGLGRAFVSPSSELSRSVFEILKPSFLALISVESAESVACGFSFYSSAARLVAGRRDSVVVKDKILCFVCAVKNIERTFNTYYELQEHLYRDHDMKKDPAMDIFNKYKSNVTKTPAADK